MCLLKPIILFQPVVTVTEMLKKRDQEIAPRGCEKPLGAQTGVWSCGVVAAVLRRETFERACVLGKWFPSLRSPHATGHLPATRDPNI